MPRIKCLSPYVWNGAMLHVGTEHEADEKEAALLVTLQWAERVPTIGEKVTAAITRRQYRRRDLTASA